MKKLWLVFVFFGMQYYVFSQDCNFTQGLTEISTFYSEGSFRRGLKLTSELLKCEELSKDEQFQLLVWEYQLQRDRLKNRRASEAILKARKLKSESRWTLDFKLLLLENFARRGPEAEYSRLLASIEQEITQISPDNYELIGRFNFSKHFGTNPDIYPEERMRFLHLALDNFNELDPPPTYYLGNTLRALGNYNRTSGDFDKSAGYYSRELELYRSVYPEDHFNLSICNYNLGGVYYEKLEYQKALDHFLAAHLIWKVTYKEDSYRMRALNEAIGDMYWELDKPDKALEFFNYATPHEKKVNNDTSESTLNLADSLLEQGNYASAMKYYEEAVKWREKTYGKDHMLTGACKNFVGRAHMSAGETIEALDAYQESITILVEEFTSSSWYENPNLNMTIQSGQYLLEALTAKGDLLKDLYHETKQLRDLEAALATQELAISLLEKIKNNKMSSSSKSFWTERTIDLIESSMDTAWRLYKQTDEVAYNAKAFNFAERSKALLLLASLYDQEISRFADIPEEILQKENQLKREINEYNGRLEAEEKRCAEVREKMLTLYRGKLQSLQNEYDLLIGEIAKDYPDYYMLKYDVEIASVESIQKEILDEQTHLVSFFLGKDHLYRFGIGKDKFTVNRFKNPEVLQTKVIELMNILRDNSTPNRNSVDYKRHYIELAHGIFRETLEDFVGDNENGDSMIIVPDGYLAYLPFESLLTATADPSTTTYRDLPYLFQKLAISYSPSATVALLTKDVKSNGKEYLGFAPDYKNEWDSDLRQKPTNLMFNQSEIEFGAELFGGKSWNGLMVTEDLLKSNLEDAGIIHLALHGEVEDERPLLSKLHFNSSKDNDGLLHIYEIYSLNIPAELVILSACNTATGKLQRGEGILSMERAFQYAGSKSLMATLWSVDDASSSHISQLFLENIYKGLPKDIAMQQAKKSFLETANPEKLHPFYWSSFRLTGNTSPIGRKFESYYYGIGIGILVFFAAIFLFRRKKKRR